MNSWSQDDLANGWWHACELRRSLVAGNPMPRLPPTTVRLFPGEVLHADLPLNHEVMYGMDVSYTHSTVAFGGPALFAAGLLVSAVGNAHRKHQAERMAAVQWRFHGVNQTILTNHRILAFAGDRWVTWDHRAIMELWPAPQEFTFTLLFNGIEPLRLSGPGAPWFGVALAHILYGSAFLAERPEFQCMSAPSRSTRSMPSSEGITEHGRERGTT
ncbi:hypothetical protein Sme01_09820 [Sphaerisporangium melleum]|uniref:Uncharacterized protein n=1 Tax=Sphaerisporangium melleum TaxID=321316 RepID=A0A917QT29_9ACTN|nr:hypothetical protein [Sphaerisporangium melleum]GGK67198.1 hypothetical protein GCM10007964_07790 [Sphaerisporangium melleum]GII68506.1 hypothetical protein Sme01_09820 [Sphaerisporangium melleum]